MDTLRSLAVMAGAMALVSILACHKGSQTQKGGQPQIGGLAGELTRAPDLKSAVQATRTALSKGGISVANGDQIVVSSTGPSSRISFSPGEAFALALEARNRPTASRMTLAELGDMLHDLGWPFESGPLPGEQLVEFLKVWVNEARKNPQDPHSFTPLFLADMAQTQVPAIDLAAGEYRPEELRLSLLELHLIAAAFDRALGSKAKNLSLPSWLLPNFAHAQGDPCSRWKDIISKSYGDLTKGTTEVGSVALKEAVKILIKKGGQYGKKFADALSALSISAKLLKVANLYAYNEFTVVVASNNPMHKPRRGEDNKEAAFTARAGVNDRDWEVFQKTFQQDEFMRAQGDCLTELGISRLPDQGDVGKDAKKWRVEWRLLPEQGLKEHAYIDRDKNPEFEKAAGGMLGQLQMNLEKSSDHSATATLSVDILPEKYEHKGIEKKVEVTAEATLETSEPPSLSTLVSAFKGGKGIGLAVGAGEAVSIGAILGITSALVEVCAGWFQEIAQPKAYATLTVTYHEPGVKLHIVDVNRAKLDFRGKNRMFGMIGGVASEKSSHVYDGYIQLGKDSAWHGQVQVTAKGVYVAADTIKLSQQAAEAQPGEDPSIEQMMKSWAKSLELLGDLPSCQGFYEGTQIFAVEGQFVYDDDGKRPQVQLALTPVDSPESYRETPNCPWGLSEIDGKETLPLRIPQGEERPAILIDEPKPGEVRKYRKSVNIPDVFGSTVITVGP